MANPQEQVSDEEVKATLAAFIANDRSQRKTAEALRCARSTVQKHLRYAAGRGFMGPIEALPGFAIKTISSKAPDGSYVKQGREPGEEYAVPIGHLIKGESALVDPDGRVVQRWVKTKLGELDPEYVADRIREKFGTMTAAAMPSAPPPEVEMDRLALHPRADLHLGLYAWGAESGRNWDLATATRIYRDTMAEVYAGTAPTDTGIVLGGGDFFHANTNEYRTQSGNVLDGDGRTDKVIGAGVELAAFDVDLALQKHRKVLVRFLKGNHDEYACIALTYALAAWYRNEPRVVVDTSPDLFWFHRFGKNLLSGTHGHNIKPAQIPMLMANRCPKEWGETEFRYGHTFHVHHKTQMIDEIGGVIVETHQSPVAQDNYHWSKGYLSGRSMQSITYHKDRGEKTRNTVTL